jgi:hypothetical protein
MYNEHFFLTCLLLLLCFALASRLERIVRWQTYSCGQVCHCASPVCWYVYQVKWALCITYKVSGSRSWRFTPLVTKIGYDPEPVPPALHFTSYFPEMQLNVIFSFSSGPSMQFPARILCTFLVSPIWGTYISSLSDVTLSYYATAFIRFSSSVYSTTTCFGLFYKAIFRWVLLKLVLVTPVC